jgi:hypothetical protein
MPRGLFDYGVEEFGDFVLEDPVLFDGIVIRMLEDIELVGYALARNSQKALDSRKLEIDDEITSLVVDALELPETGQAPPQLRDFTRDFIRQIARAPFPYTDAGLDQIAGVAADVMFDAFRFGAQGALGEGSKRIGLRHLLPACEGWPYPLNRYC